jgi:hypothetical protein
MLQGLLRDRIGLSLPGLQLALLVWWLDPDLDKPAWLPQMLLLGTGLFGHWRSLRHARLIDDTPTARVASAAQGYVELRGRGLPLAGLPVLSPLNGLPVLWWRLRTEKRQSNGKWRQESIEQSQASFLLDDGSGRCLVDPEGAEMLVQRREVTQQDEHRYTLWTLLPQDPLYVLGFFRTLGNLTDSDLSESQRLRERLEHWKADQAGLLRRFDLDGNREIDLKEWELARAQARRELRQQQAEAAAAPQLHRVSACPNGRLYLISDLEPGRIALRFKLWAGFHLLVLLGSAAALGWLAQQAAR